MIDEFKMNQLPKLIGSKKVEYPKGIFQLNGIINKNVVDRFKPATGKRKTFFGGKSNKNKTKGGFKKTKKNRICKNGCKHYTLQK